MCRLLFKTLTVYDASLESTVQYMTAAMAFIQNMLKTTNTWKTGLCPFQFDMVIAMGEPKQIQNTDFDIDNSNDDDDDDDDDADAADDPQREIEKYANYIGNIEEKLKQNKVRYSCTGQVAMMC